MHFLRRQIVFCAFGLAAPAVLPMMACCADAVEQVVNTAAKDLSQHYGFEKLELFKVEQRSFNMLAGDLNHDGLTDLVVVDNSHSRIDLLQQRSEKPKTPKLSSPPRDVNLVGDDWRFERRRIPVAKQIAAMTLGDFNADGRTDIAYFGVPDRLVIRLQPQAGDWTNHVSLRLPDVAPAQWVLAAGDLNQDSRDDLAVLGKNDSYILYQQPNGTLGRPRRLRNTSDNLALAQIADVDGDGRRDLCYLADEGDRRTLCARFQTADHRLGPELQYDLNKPRSVALANLDAVPGHEVLVIESQTGRVKVLQFERPSTADGALASRPIRYGFGGQDSGRHRDLAIGDLDADGLADVIVSDPEAAQMIVFRQEPKMGLDLGNAFPGFDGTDQVRLWTSDKDKTAEVVTLSTREKTIGLSHMQDGRLSFPRALPIQDEPLALELADLNHDGKSEIVYIAKKRVGRDSQYRMSALMRNKQGDWEPHPLAKRGGENNQATLELRGTPERLVQLDANNDGRPEFLVFLGLDRPPHLLTIGENGDLIDVPAQGGIQFGTVPAGAVFLGQLQTPVVLVAQGKFARNLRLDQNHQWQVLDQYNAVESSANIVGVAAVDFDGDAGNEIALVDSGVKKLRVLRQENGLFVPWHELDLGTFAFKSCHVADLDADGRDDLLLFGSNKFAVVYPGRSDPKLNEIASYETKREEVFLADIVAGDLNGDGHVNAALIDTRTHFVELIDFQPIPSKPDAQRASSADDSAGLRRALHFKVFEEKSFSNRETSGEGLREAVIADVTNDGRADLVLLAHDRVLLYPQDDGK